MNQEYISPVPGKIPIIAWGPLPGVLSISTHDKMEAEVRQIFTKLIECGCNAVLYGDHHDRIYSVLQDVNPKNSYAGKPAFKIPFILSMDYITATPFSSVYSIDFMVITRQT